MKDNRTVTKPKIVVLCGSSRFVDVMAVCAWLIERDEKAITMGLHLLPQWYPDCPPHHLAEHEGVADAMDELHLRKIDLADEIFVVDMGGYIGESTTREIAYAESLGKPVRRFSSDAVYEKLGVLLKEAKSGRIITPAAYSCNNFMCDWAGAPAEVNIEGKKTLCPKCGEWCTVYEDPVALAKLVQQHFYNSEYWKAVSFELAREAATAVKVRKPDSEDEWQDKTTAALKRVEKRLGLEKPR